MLYETGKGAHSWPWGPLGCRSGGPCQPTSLVVLRSNNLCSCFSMSRCILQKFARLRLLKEFKGDWKIFRYSILSRFQREKISSSSIDFFGILREGKHALLLHLEDIYELQHIPTYINLYQHVSSYISTYQDVKIYQHRNISTPRTKIYQHICQHIPIYIHTHQNLST